MRFRAAPFFVLPHQPIRWSAHTVFFYFVYMKNSLLLFTIIRTFSLWNSKKMHISSVCSVHHLFCWLSRKWLASCSMPFAKYLLTGHELNNPLWIHSEMNRENIENLHHFDFGNKCDEKRGRQISGDGKKHAHEQINLIKPRESQKVTLFVVDIAGCVSSQKGDAEL